MRGCKACHSLTSEPIKNEKGENLFWMVANKGTKDFFILLSSMQQHLIGSLGADWPKEKEDFFDFYCTKCFLELTKDIKK